VGELAATSQGLTAAGGLLRLFLCEPYLLFSKGKEKLSQHREPWALGFFFIKTWILGLSAGDN